jgi:hypothetical protein
MRHPLFGGRIGTRRQNAQIAIALQAVGIDDGPLEGLRQLQRKR